MDKDIYRLLVCQWAYGWDNERLSTEIGDFLTRKSWEDFFRREEESKKSLDNLVLEIKNKTMFDGGVIYRDLETPKNRSYGNKYIKRKYR